MRVFPANATGWFWHCLARETGLIGHLYSPGAQVGPIPWFPYCMDNGCFSLWNPGDNSFDEGAWNTWGEARWLEMLLWAESVNKRPLWMIVPDRPGNGLETIAKWNSYAPELKRRAVAKLAIAVQDGMTTDDIRSLEVQPDVICVGGSTSPDGKSGWKWETVEMWAREFPRVHVLRCNSPDKLEYLNSLGVESCDGTGWNRGDRRQTEGLEKFVRAHGKPIEPLLPLAHMVCRSTRKTKQLTLFP